MTNIERCKNCIIPKSTIGINFYEDNCCEICHNNTGESQHGSNVDELLQQIDSIKSRGKNHPYDCLVGLSGGRDSSFLIYQLVVKHKLRCMAAYHRTPFTPDVIDKNVHNLTAKLNVPLIKMDISNSEHLAFTRRMILKWVKNNDKFIANIACAPCKKHNHEIYKIAKKHNIGCIVFGGNKYEQVQFGAGQLKKYKLNKMKEISSLDKIKQTITVAMRGVLLLSKWPELVFDFPTLFKSSILYLNNRSPYLRMRYSKIKMLDYYYLAGYDERQVTSCLLDNGWKMPENCNSVWRADCSFNEIKNYMFKKQFNANYTDAYLSNLVRGGVITRDEALKRSEVEGQISKERIKEVCDILEVSVDLFN